MPFDRDGTGSVRYHQHVGVYAYTRDALERWVRLPPVPEERWERLEQLRPLLHGLPIGVAGRRRPAAPRLGPRGGLRARGRALTPPLQAVQTPPPPRPSSLTGAR